MMLMEKNALYIKKGIDVDMTGHFNFYRRLDDPRQVAELTSRQDSSEIPKTLKKMFVSKSDEKTYPYDICLATNMIQVGIDIPRLSLMVINGQPKTTLNTSKPRVELEEIRVAQVLYLIFYLPLNQG